MARFLNLTAVALVMQFGGDKPIDFAPDGEADVPDRWVPLVVSRGYRVKMTSGPTPAMAQADAAGDSVEAEAEDLIALIRAAKVPADMDALFPAFKALRDRGLTIATRERVAKVGDEKEREFRAAGLLGSGPSEAASSAPTSPESPQAISDATAAPAAGPAAPEPIPAIVPPLPKKGGR